MKQNGEPIKGYSVNLTNDRKVFVGKRNGEPSYYLEFANRGTLTRLKLSPEAMDATLLMQRALETGWPSKTVNEDVRVVNGEELFWVAVPADAPAEGDI